MKQYTDKDQTAKLIELGFPKPQSIVDVDVDYSIRDHTIYNAYSIGELIEFLCPHLHTTIYRLEMQKQIKCFWDVEVMDVNENSLDYQMKQEFIDALFCACITLKEQGVI